MSIARTQSALAQGFDLEPLEGRTFFSLAFDHHDAEALVAAAAKGGAPGGGTSGPAIRLDLVALHEFGHSLGLDHSSDSTSIMYAYYNANYNPANFAADSAVTTLQTKYATANSGPWKDSLDPAPGNGRVDITYSYMPDGARMDSGSNTLFKTFNGKFDNASTWQSIFGGELARWASASGGKLNFVARSDNGASFNTSGTAQNDSRFGDIRIGAHRFDGASKTLAHAYFPPPNGATAAGDAHFDHSENWITAGALASTFTSSSKGKTSGSSLATLRMDGNDARSSSASALLGKPSDVAATMLEELLA